MEVRFPITPGVEASEDEDYSASVSAIMLRRGSTRRSRRSRLTARRPSSPFPPEIDVGGARRRSSAYTTSSGETAISMEETAPQEVTQEQIYDNIRLHKEVLHSVNQQPLGMRRKLKLVHQAKAYIKRHEGALQERLAQSKSTRDIVARFNILLATKWQHMKREAANLSNLLIPWELRIKEIESHFGSVVASYFTFLRWLFWVNMIIAVMLITFVIVPEILTATDDPDRKDMLPEEKNVSINLLILWEFEGVLKYSPIFYGFYSNKDSGEAGYRMPFAYFMTGLAVYVYSFVATLRKMAENSRMSKLSEKEDECIFSWKLFTGWDFMIGNTETAHNRTSSIILGFKEALLEEAEKKKDPRNWKIISQRVLVNTCVLILLGISAYAVVSVVIRSKTEGADGWWEQNEITIVISLITFIFPYLFEILGFLEGYHPRKQLRVQLGRIMLLNLLNLYALIIALFNKIDEMTKLLEQMNPHKVNITSTTMIPPTRLRILERNTLISTTIPSISDEIESCQEVVVDCSNDLIYTPVAPAYLLRNVPAFIAATLLATTNAPAMPNQTEVMTASNHNTLESLVPLTFYTKYDTLNTSNPYDDSMIKSYDISEEKFDELEDDGDFDYSSITNFEVDGDIDRKNDKPATETTTDSTTTIFTNDYTGNAPTTYDLYNSESTNIENTITEKSTTQFDKTVSDTAIGGSTYVTFNYAASDMTTDSTTALDTIDYTESTLDSSNMTNSVSSSTEDTDDIETSTYNYPKSSQSDISAKGPTQVSRVVTSSKPTTTTKPCLVKICRNTPGTTLSTTTRATTVPIPTSTESLEQKQTKEAAKVLENKRKLRKLCWETMFGQEMVKLTMMDMMMTIITTLFMDFIRAVFVRFMNRCWCWDLEKKFPQYGDFKIAENILHLVNNQGMVWMGMFFSPGLVLINIIKLIIMMYLRSWAVMTCNVPHEVVFRASRSNNFYLALLLTMLFLCVLPVGYAIVWVKPSWHCGPFAGYERMYYLVTTSLEKFLPVNLKLALDYVASPGIVIPLLVLLVLIIYYLLSLTNSLREANNDLKIQLRRERTEERRKMFQIADRRRRVGSNDLENTPFAKWKKILPMLPPSKSIDSNEKKGNEETESGKKSKNFKGDIFAKIVKMARKSNEVSTAVDKNTLTAPIADDETDTEFHETLPEDLLRRTDIRKKKQSTGDNTKNEKKHSNKGDGKGTADPEDRDTMEKKQSVFIKLEDEISPHKTKKRIRKLRRQETEGNHPIAEPKKKYKSRKHHTEDYPSRDSSEKTHTADDKNENDVSENILELKKKETVHQKDSFELKSSKRLKNKQTNDVNIQTKPLDSSSVIPVITISKMESDDETLDKADPSVTTLSRSVIATQYEDDEGTSSTISAETVEKSGSCASLKTLRRQSSVDSIKGPEKGAIDKN